MLCLRFWKHFLCLLIMNMGFFSFILLIWCNALIDLHMLNHPCIPELNPTWSFCMKLLMFCWNWFANICWRVLHLYLSGTRHAVFFSLVVSLSGQISKWLFFCSPQESGGVSRSKSHGWRLPKIGAARNFTLFKASTHSAFSNLWKLSIMSLRDYDSSSSCSM